MHALTKILLIFTLTAPVQADPLTEYVSWYLRIYPYRLDQALTYVPIVNTEARAQNWDPLLVGVIISCESSWTGGIVSQSTLGEQGLMQVHGVAARGFDLSTPEGQIAAGVTWLTRSRERCGDDLPRIIARYMTGSCGKVGLWRVQRRLRLYREASWRFGKRERTGDGKLR